MAAAETGVDYKAVLKDLEAQKARIDAAIAGVRQLLSMPALGSGAGSAAAGAEPVNLSDHPFLGMSIGEASKKYLQMKKSKQTVKEIADALERGGLHHVSTNFPATVATMVNRYAKTDSELISAGKGEWALAAWYGNRRPKPVEPGRKKKRAHSAGKAASATKTKAPSKPAPSSDAAEPTSREMTVAVLRAAGTPMHVDAMIEAIKARFGKDVPRGTIVTMVADSVRRGKQFKRTEPNTFALLES
jgi:hypothetical protein